MISLILCSLMPRQLAADGGFGSSRAVLVGNQTRKYCSCGPTLFQTKYCSADFVIAVKKYSEPERFYPDPKWIGFNYAGLVMPLVVHQVLRGPIEPKRVIKVHFIQGSNCGVSPGMIPHDDDYYIITGFRHTFFKKDGKDGKAREAKEVLLVTRCSASEPLQSLSITQIAGAFLPLYCAPSSCESKVYFDGSSPDLNRPNDTCLYPYRARMCYSKYTICSRQSGGRKLCRFKAVRRAPTSPALLARIPPVLHSKWKESQLSRITDEERFKACLRTFGGV